MIQLSLSKGLDKIEHAITELATRTGPILGPVPTAYLVGRATIEHLAWPFAVAIVAALVVECLGLATTSTALTLWNYNKDKRKSDPAAPFRLSIVLVAVYFVVAVGLTVALDVAPKLAIFSPAIYPALSLTGTGILAIRADHRRRIAAIEADKSRRRADRKRRRQERQQVEAQAEIRRQREELERQRAEIAAEANRKRAEIERQRAEAQRQRVEATLATLGTEAETLRHYAGNPAATQSEVAETLGTSERTIRNHLGKLESLGLVDRSNGGVKVLVDLGGNGKDGG